MRNDPLQAGIQIDSLETICHGKSWRGAGQGRQSTWFIVGYLKWFAYQTVCLAV
jgi:hypothetical protein